MLIYIVMFFINFGVFIYCNWVAYLINKLNAPKYLVILDVILGFGNLLCAICWASKIIGELQ